MVIIQTQPGERMLLHLRADLRLGGDANTVHKERRAALHTATSFEMARVGSDSIMDRSYTSGEEEQGRHKTCLNTHHWLHAHECLVQLHAPEGYATRPGRRHTSAILDNEVISDVMGLSCNDGDDGAHSQRW